jgi:hypothetical protein
VNEGAAPAHTIAANLRWFAVVYVIALIVLSFVVNLLRTVGVPLPSAGLGIGGFVARVYLAGSR